MKASSPTAGEPAVRNGYDIRVAGHLDDHWSERLGGLTLTRGLDGTTTLRGPIADQTQLHGVLAAIRDIGAALLEVRPAPIAPEPVLCQSLPTERLTLRPATTDDVTPTWRFRQLAEVNNWLSGTPADLDGYRALFNDPERLASTVVVQLGHQQESEVIGDFMLRREDAWAQLDVAHDARGAQAELGWVLDPAFTGRGFATEAVRELLRYCFEELRVRRVTANCFLANEASWRLMERVGMRREGHAVNESLHRSGRWLDTLTYALLADEWAASAPAIHAPNSTTPHPQL